MMTDLVLYTYILGHVDFHVSLMEDESRNSSEIITSVSQSYLNAQCELELQEIKYFHLGSTGRSHLRMPGVVAIMLMT